MSRFLVARYLRRAAPVAVALLVALVALLCLPLAARAEEVFALAVPGNWRCRGATSQARLWLPSRSEGLSSWGLPAS